jgi:carbonic anhydrase/acetyltransferase-like protein (isoleucine patch superfamily)
LSISDADYRDDIEPQTIVRRILKVLTSPRLAIALLNAQIAMRGKATLPLSVRLFGRIFFKAGGEVQLGDGVCLVGTVVPIEIVSHKGSRISIGSRTFINYGASITAHHQVLIGSDCLLGHHLRIADRSDHGLDHRTDKASSTSVTIGDSVWVGAHAIILPGVSIGNNSAIGAGSVVAESVPANCIAVGNPARVLRHIGQPNPVEA